MNIPVTASVSLHDFNLKQNMDLFVSANFLYFSPFIRAPQNKRWSVALLEVLVRAREWFPSPQLKEVQDRFLEAKDKNEYDVHIESHIFHIVDDRVQDLKLRNPLPILQLVKNDNFLEACDRFSQRPDTSVEQKQFVTDAQNKIIVLAQKSLELHHELTSLTFQIQAARKQRFRENRARDKRIGMLKRKQRIQHSQRSLLAHTSKQNKTICTLKESSHVNNALSKEQNQTIQ